MFVGLYLASNFNRMQSASNIELNINVQEVLPAVHRVDYLKVNLQIEEIHTIIYYGDLHCVKSFMKICLFSWKLDTVVPPCKYAVYMKFQTVV